MRSTYELRIFLSVILVIILLLPGCSELDEVGAEDGDQADGDQAVDGDIIPADGDEVPLDGDASLPDGDDLPTDGDAEFVDGDMIESDVVDGDMLDGDMLDGDLADGDADIDGDAESDGDIIDGDYFDGDIDEDLMEIDVLDRDLDDAEMDPEEFEEEGESYEWPAWPLTLHITDNANYCSTFDEIRTLEEEYEKKAKLDFPAGDFPLPDVNGTYAYPLPFTLQFRDPDSAPQPSVMGSITANHDESRYRFTIIQAMEDGEGQAWEFKAMIYGPLAKAATVTIDGVHNTVGSEETLMLNVCKGDCSQWLDRRGFDSCSFNNVTLEQHHVILSDGVINLDFRKGMSMASTEPGLFTFANGMLGTSIFLQADFWKLIYNPSHHHFTRDFIVLFNTPISGACGVKVENFIPWPDSELCTVHTVDCALKNIAELTVVSQSIN